MSVPASHSAVVVDWFRALLLGDLPTLTTCSLHTPGLCSVTPLRSQLAS